MAFVKKVLKQVTLPVLKLKKNVERFFMFTGPMKTGKKIDDQMGPAEVLPATDLETGEIGLIIVPTVMQKELMENYPEHAYVGKCFAILLTNVPGKRYNLVTMAEIAPPDEIPTFDPAAKAAQDAAQAGQPDVEPDAESVPDVTTESKATPAPASAPAANLTKTPTKTPTKKH